MKMKAVANSTAVLAIASMTARRFLRSRILLIAVVFAALPLLPFLLGAHVDSSELHRWRDYVALTSAMQLLVAALLSAPAIAEEIEDKTYAYLWSRPISRWTVLAGKLLTASLLGIALFAIAVIAGKAITDFSNAAMVGKAIVGLGFGVITASCMASAFGTLMPKYPLAFSISYFLVLDMGIGAMPFAGARLSVMHNVMEIAGLGESPGFLTSVAWLLGLASFWTLVGLWRLARNELSTGS